MNENEAQTPKIDDEFSVIARIQQSQEEMIELLPYYQISTTSLKEHFLTQALDILTQTLLYSFEINLFRFRSIIPIQSNQTFFSFDQPSLSDINERINFLYYRDPPDYEGKTISEKLSSFFDVPWISDYFAIVAFPDFYEQFFGREHQQAALKFLRYHKDDPLNPKLVVTFLLHAYVFRDRFMTSLFSRCMKEIQSNGAITSDPMIIITETFEETSHFYSNEHFEALNIFEGEKQLTIIKDLWTEYLTMISFSGLFLSKTLHDFIDSAKNAINSMDMENSKVFITKPCTLFEVPKVEHVIFNGGEVFPLTLLDSEILHAFPETQFSKDKFAKPTPNPLELAFTLNSKAVHLFKNQMQIPEITDTKNVLDCLRIQKKAIEFVSKRSWKLSYFSALGSSTQKIRTLQFSFFSSQNSNDICSVEKQRFLYIWPLFNRYFEKNINILLINRGNTAPDAREVFITETRKMIEENIHKTISDNSDVILDFIKDTANSYKQEAHVPGRISPSKAQYSTFREYDSISMEISFCKNIQTLENDFSRQFEEEMNNASIPNTTVNTNTSNSLNSIKSIRVLEKGTENVIEHCSSILTLLIKDKSLSVAIELIKILGNLKDNLEGIGDVENVKNYVISHVFTGQNSQPGKIAMQIASKILQPMPFTFSGKDIQSLLEKILSWL